MLTNFIEHWLTCQWHDHYLCNEVGLFLHVCVQTQLLVDGFLQNLQHFTTHSRLHSYSHVEHAVCKFITFSYWNNELQIVYIMCNYTQLDSSIWHSWQCFPSNETTSTHITNRTNLRHIDLTNGQRFVAENHSIFITFSSLQHQLKLVATALHKVRILLNTAKTN